jgi:hypothetical protein
MALRRAIIAAGMIACMTLGAVSQAGSQDAVRHPTAATKSSSIAPATTRSPTRKDVKLYFVEFRARSAQSYGHTFLVHGRIGQKIAQKDVVGLHPFTESSIPWMIGHLVWVPSETGASDGDVEEQYVIARYRIILNQEEYKRVARYLKERQANAPVWHAVLYNCNAFIADIAKFMGLKTPASTLLMPKNFINELKELNVGIKAAIAPAAHIQ